MHQLYFTLFALLCLGPSLSSANALNGVSLTFTNQASYGTPSSNSMSSQIHSALNANTISVRQYLSMKRYDQVDFKENTTPSIQDFQNHFKFMQSYSMQTAFTLGITVLDTTVSGTPAAGSNFYTWHGLIDFDSVEKFNLFFSRYQAILQRYLSLCIEETQCSLFSIANELNSLYRTKPFSNKNEEQAFVRQIKFGLASKDPEEKLYYKKKVAFLNSFRESFMTSNDSSTQITNHAIQNTLHEWVNSGGTVLLYPQDESYLVQAENLRREFLLKKWKTLIANLKSYRDTLVEDINVHSDYIHVTPQFTINANHDAYQDIGFWDDLDVFAINAYFTLANKDALEIPKAEKNITTDFLQARWSDVLQTLKNYKDALGIGQKPTVITELGFTQNKFTTVYPWAYTGMVFFTAPDDILPKWHRFDEYGKDPNERVRGMDALAKAIKNNNDLHVKGALIWDAPTETLKGNYTIPLNADDPYAKSIRSLFEAIDSST